MEEKKRGIAERKMGLFSSDIKRGKARCYEVNDDEELCKEE